MEPLEHEDGFLLCRWEKTPLYTFQFQKRKTDLLPPRTITAAKIAPAANSEASVSNPPTG